MAKKKVEEKIELYARNGMTLYDVTKFPNLMGIFNESIKLIMECQKAGTLPYVVYVKSEDLININHMLFGEERRVSIFLYMSAHKDAKAVIKIGDIAEAGDEFVVGNTPEGLETIK